MSTAYIWEELFTYHEMGYLHPESPKRLLSIKEVLESNGVGRELTKIDSRPATKEEIAFIHDEVYIKRVEGTDGENLTHLDPDTSANRYSWKAAQLAAGSAIRCAEVVASGEHKNAFAFLRPPGHHAERDKAMGFCFFNNVAIAAEWLIRSKKADRVAIIDFDVHHGNGTQHAFSKRPDVLFVSSHRHPFFPGTGSEDEIGEGEGEGYTLNIPLKGGASDDDYKRVFDVVSRRVEKYRPNFILASAGYDSHRADPLGGMDVTTDGFRYMMARLVDLSREFSDGRLVAILEGGYNLKALRDSVEVQLEEMVSG
ncbi:MAG: histone deacetylase [Deltaproteobacteria bacterium]|jgi:acetoin utilization deacetylase AcuC-like enzyme|nr:histone deacetylase [Deltaproteobacteria bacterium]